MIFHRRVTELLIIFLITSMGLTTGGGRATQRLEVIVLSGMIRFGGAVATTALCSSPEVGITGMRVGGILPGATLQRRIAPTTVRSTAIVILLLIR